MTRHGLRTPHRRVMTLKPFLKPLIIVVAIAAISLYWRHWIHERRALQKAEARALVAKSTAAQGRSPHPNALPGATLIETAHYAITSTANVAQTQQVAEAVESLYVAYADVFATHRAPAAAARGKLKLTLYAHQAQFKANNRSLPWAEAYYLRPICYAYYAKDESNPYHWMVHEATHQLNAEVSGFPKTRWVDEGLATYFGTSTIEPDRSGRGKLVPGKIDPGAYPIWWLTNSGLTGSLDKDIDAGNWVPIRALITGIDAPSIASNVNGYYIQYWSLSHFLFHGENGRYAAGYKRLIAEGGSLANFERLIGPADRIEVKWYRYLQDKIAERTPQTGKKAATPVISIP